MPEAETGLFHIPHDPEEKHDLSAAQTADVARLKAMYEAWKQDFPETPWAPGGRSDGSEEPLIQGKKPL